MPNSFSSSILQHLSQLHDPSEPGSALGRSTEWLAYFNYICSPSWPSISGNRKLTRRQGVKQSANFSFGTEETVIIFDIIFSHSASLIWVVISKESDLNILKTMQASVFPVAYDLKINGSLISKQICFGETWSEFNTRYCKHLRTLPMHSLKGPEDACLIHYFHCLHLLKQHLCCSDRTNTWKFNLFFLLRSQRNSILHQYKKKSAYFI